MLQLHPDADAELDFAVAWHEEQRPNSGLALFGEIRRRILQASAFPASGALVEGFDEKYEVRGFTLQRFPYVVIVACVQGRRVVVAVAHTSREPGYWHDRIE